MHHANVKLTTDHAPDGDRLSMLNFQSTVNKWCTTRPWGFVAQAILIAWREVCSEGQLAPLRSGSILEDAEQSWLKVQFAWTGAGKRKASVDGVGSASYSRRVPRPNNQQRYGGPGRPGGGSGGRGGPSSSGGARQHDSDRNFLPLPEILSIWSTAHRFAQYVLVLYRPWNIDDLDQNRLRFTWRALCEWVNHELDPPPPTDRAQRLTSRANQNSCPFADSISKNDPPTQTSKVNSRRSLSLLPLSLPFIEPSFAFGAIHYLPPASSCSVPLFSQLPASAATLSFVLLDR